MQRLRELMAHGGIAVLALVFALGFAAYGLATAVARESQSCECVAERKGESDLRHAGGPA